jgi:hypothetical protein
MLRLGVLVIAATLFAAPAFARSNPTTSGPLLKSDEAHDRGDNSKHDDRSDHDKVSRNDHDEHHDGHNDEHHDEHHGQCHFQIGGHDYDFDCDHHGKPVSP